MPEDNEPLLSISKAARQIGVDRSVLGKQVRAGAVRGHHGRVRLSEVLEDRARNIDLTRSGRRSGELDGDENGTAPVSHAGPEASAVPLDDEPPVLVDGQSMPFKEARALKETYLARLRRLEYDLKSGEVVPIDVVIGATVAQLQRVRNKMLGLGSRVAPRAAILRDAEQVQALVDGEVVQILEELTTGCEGHVTLDEARATFRKLFATEPNG